MDYISKTQIIRYFSKYRIGDNVILISNTRTEDKIIRPPVYGTVTGINFINKKAETSIPKYRRSEISKIQIDPDLIMYTFTAYDNSFCAKVFEHALIQNTDAHRSLSEENCNSLYRSRHKHFKSLIHARRKKRITKNSIRAIIMLALSVWLTVSTFSKEHWAQSVIFAVLYLLITAITFAVTNRRVQRIRYK